MKQLNDLIFMNFKLNMLNIENEYKYNIVQNGEYSLTHYATSNISNSICFANTKEFAIKANRNEKISSVITTDSLKPYVSNQKGLIVTENPKKLFFEIHNQLAEKYSFKRKKIQVGKSSIIHPTAILKNGVIVGNGTKIGAYSIIEEGTVIGNDVLIENHVIIGARGMHNTKINGKFVHVKDLGNVIISDGCEILSHAVIQKPYFYHSTFIGKDTRVSVHCDIGHGCSIGERCLIAGHSVIAGYCSIGNDVWIGPNSTLSHVIEVRDNARIILGSVVIQDVGKEESVSGNFAHNHNKNLKLFTLNKK